MNHAAIAITKPINEPVIHFFAFSTPVLSHVIPELICIIIAWYISENTATVPAIFMSTSITETIAKGIVFISTLPSSRAWSSTPSILVELEEEIHQFAPGVCHAGHGPLKAAVGVPLHCERSGWVVHSGGIAKAVYIFTENNANIYMIRRNNFFMRW